MLANLPDDLDDLLHRAVESDRAALETLLYHHHDRLVDEIGRSMMSRLRRYITPEDVAQETYCVVFRKIATFEPRGAHSFFAWLASIAHNKMSDLDKALRAEKRGGERRQIDVQHAAAEDTVRLRLEMLAVTERTPSRSAVEREQAEQMRQLLARVPADYGQALTLYYMDQLSCAEIAARLGRSEGAVHMLLYRGREWLYQMIQELERTKGPSPQADGNHKPERPTSAGDTRAVAPRDPPPEAGPSPQPT